MAWINIGSCYSDDEAKVKVVSGCFNSALKADFNTVFNSTFNVNEDILSDSEKRRSANINNQLNRLKFVSSRIFLRRAIGQVMETKPYKGEFFIDSYGKPHLPESYSTLSFNLSHTKNVFCAAFSHNQDIGIDIEMSTRKIPLPLLEYAFNAKEAEQILASKDWRQAFLKGWTSKEAVLKCIGCGLQRDPREIHLYFDEKKQHYLNAYEQPYDNDIKLQYRLIPLPIFKDIIGVVAIRSS